MNYSNKSDDQLLISASLKGDKKALEQVIKNHQDWIYNVALTFTGEVNLAFDLTQEVLIKLITKLSTFQQKSNFKTWLYRIIKNHFLNTQRSKNHIPQLTFEQFGQGLDTTPDESLSDYSYNALESILVEEAKISCMKGMLLCLEPEQRLIYILGELFEFTDSISAEVMEITKENFRVKLHRARQQLYNFMNSKCGLINKKNPCRCARKTAGFIQKGFVDPESLHFQKDKISTIEKAIDQKVSKYSLEVISEYQQLYQKHPFLQCPDSLESIKNLLASDLVKDTFNLNE